MQKEKWLHRSVPRVMVSLLKRRSPNVRATPWPTREVPTSFLLQFKRALPPVLSEEMSAIVDGIGHTEKISFVDMNNIVAPRRGLVEKWNSSARDTPALCSAINIKIWFHGIRRGVKRSARYFQIVGVTRSRTYTIYFTGESATDACQPHNEESGKQTAVV